MPRLRRCSRLVLEILFQRGCFAQACHIGIGGCVAKHLVDLGRRSIATKGGVQGFAPVQAHQVGDEADLRVRPVAVGAVHLPVDVAGVDASQKLRNT